MYNAEEYISKCLDSLLAQTFQDFEVIVVDDCSTDSSCDIVESYAEKFGEQLRLIHTEKNSEGGGYVPRNIGLKLARGEYVYFADADDFLAETALDTFYKAAKEYDADVVYTAAHYQSDKVDEVFIWRDGKGRNLADEGLEDKIELIVDEPDKNLQMLIFDRGFTQPWTKFIRRELLIKNQITFPEITKAADHIWTIEVYCHAKRLLRLPTPLYFYNRHNVGSISMKKRSWEEQISFWLSSFIEWLKTLNALQRRTDFLKNNPSYCYEAAIRDFEWMFRRFNQERPKDVDKQAIYEILYREFGKKADPAYALLPFFFFIIEDEKLLNEEDSRTIKKLREELNQIKERRASSA